MPSVYTAQRRLRERLLRSPRFRRFITRRPASARTGTLAGVVLAFPQWQREVLIADTARELEQLGPAVRSWGDRRAVVANFNQCKGRLPWQSLANEPNFPVPVWSLSRRVDRPEPTD